MFISTHETEPALHIGAMRLQPLVFYEDGSVDLEHMRNHSDSFLQPIQNLDQNSARKTFKDDKRLELLSRRKEC